MLELFSFLVVICLLLLFIYLAKSDSFRLVTPLYRNSRITYTLSTPTPIITSTRRNERIRITPDFVSNLNKPYYISPSNVRPIYDTKDVGTSPIKFNEEEREVTIQQIRTLPRLSNRISPKSICSTPAFIFDESRKFGSKAEKMCANIFENFLGRSVQIGIRPDFLKNPRTGRNLELDMYDPITKIAVEYNGQQHYKKVDSFNNDLLRQKENDQLKMRLCEDEGVILIVVPYTVDKGYRSQDDRYRKLKEYLIPRLKQAMIEHTGRATPFLD